MKKLFRPLRHVRKIVKKIATKNNLVIAISAGVLFIAVMLLWVSTWQIPTLESFEERKVAQSTKIYDKTGEVLLYDVFQNVKRTIVPFEEISQNSKDAVLAIEDKDFYNHNGVKPISFLRAALVNLFSLEFSQGGSTITQQAVKNSLLTGEKKIPRKIKEWVLAIKLEKILSKDQIFAMYLNEIPYGGTIYGIEEASNAFFGKKAKDVTLAEAAYLAAIPNAPTFYSPYGKNKDRLDERKNLVLRLMKENSFITDQEYEQAKNEKVEFKPRSETGIKAPHFVLYVIDELVKKYGEEVLEQGGLRVITTLDYSLQETAETLGKEYALENEKSSNAENIALVAIDPTNGAILSMVGSRDYFDTEIDGNFNVAIANRQPGSAFKPFAYAQAFLEGYTPDTVLFDTETEFSTTCNPDGTPRSATSNCYHPENYDLVYRGPVSMRNALAQSINIPAIKTLYLAGMRDTLRLAKDMGITSLTNVDQYGLTLVLGGGEVSLLDMTSAYGVFANGGDRHPYYAISEIKDKNGKVIEKHEDTSIQVLDKNVALQISDILADDAARAPAFGANSPLSFPGRDVAVKTGTTNDYRDAWVIGYTPHIAIGAWAGNNDNSAMQKKIARYLIVPYWNLVMKEALKTTPNEVFEQPMVDDSEDLKPILRGDWQDGPIHTILYFVDKDNPRGPVPNNPGSDSQFDAWEYGVRKWVSTNNIRETSGSGSSNHDRLLVEFINPRQNSTYPKNQTMTVRVEIDSENPISKVDYYINGKMIGSSNELPFTLSFAPGDIQGIKTTNTLKVTVTDTRQNKTSKEVRFKVN